MQSFFTQTNNQQNLAVWLICLILLCLAIWLGAEGQKPAQATSNLPLTAWLDEDDPDEGGQAA